MAFRLLSSRFSIRGLFKSNPKINNVQSEAMRQNSVFVEPSVPFLEKPSVVFSADSLKHHYGALPMVVIVAIGFTLEMMAIIRLAITRDDVYYTRNSAACEVVETRPGYSAPVRKLLVINQKYENPRGLVEAIQGDVNGPPFCFPDDNCEEEGSGISGKILAAHAVAGLGVLGMVVAL